MTLHFRCKWEKKLQALIRIESDGANWNKMETRKIKSLEIFISFKINVILMFKCIFFGCFALTQWQKSIIAVINVCTSDEHCQLISASQHNWIEIVNTEQKKNEKKNSTEKTLHLFRLYFRSSAWNKSAFNFKYHPMKNHYPNAVFLSISAIQLGCLLCAIFFVFIKTHPIWFCLVDRSYHHQIYFQEMYLKFCCL